ncbi:hypothetical protein E4U42_007850 [Claviceps africana]|uniref:Apple domain-containing protein n=1 Tax=Claviceps africana TaxID=83212 RepID=A0A8K0J0I1_9HYPO|nr:hypothetical protein E4U42_007850 [Claviceps africana]
MAHPYRLLPFLCLLLAAARLLKATDTWDYIAPPQCGYRGYRWGMHFESYTAPNLRTINQCGALCQGTEKCRSFSLSSKHCRLYRHRNPVVQLLRFRVYWDKICIDSHAVCAARGRPRFYLMKEWAESVADNSWSGCRRRCQNDPRCQSFALGVAADGRCHLYDQTVALNNNFHKPEHAVFWDITCDFVVEDVPGFKSKPVFKNRHGVREIPEKVQTVTTTTTDYLPFVTDSPPLPPPSKAVPPNAGYANQDEFTKSYTYTQYELPPLATPGSMALRPGEVPAPKRPDWTNGSCLVSTGTWGNFSLVDEEFTPIVWQRSHPRYAARLTPLVPPNEVPVPGWHLVATREPLDVPIDAFFLQDPRRPDKPVSPPGLFDMLMIGHVTRYVALRLHDGEFVLLDPLKMNEVGSELVTTIFRVDCKGGIRLEVDGEPWAWAVVTRGAEREADSAPQLLETRVKALRDNPNPEKNVFRAVANGHYMSQKARGLEGPPITANMSVNAAPKCPDVPGQRGVGLEARLLEKNRPGLGNVCVHLANETRESAFDFSGPCIMQSKCYDRCDQYNWEHCNDLFIELSMTYCFDHWARSYYDIAVLLACTSRAKYYAIYLSSRYGKELYGRAQDAMCSCTCATTDTSAMCMNSVTKSWYCADIAEQDDKNCGACGPRNQCGTTCVDFKNNPFHCGRCGRACPSGYCVEGICYTLEGGSKNASLGVN